MPGSPTPAAAFMMNAGENASMLLSTELRYTIRKMLPSPPLFSRLGGGVTGLSLPHRPPTNREYSAVVNAVICRPACPFTKQPESALVWIAENNDKLNLPDVPSVGAELPGGGKSSRGSFESMACRFGFATSTSPAGGRIPNSSPARQTVTPRLLFPLLRNQTGRWPIRFADDEDRHQAVQDPL